MKSITVCRARRSQEQTFLRDSFSQPGAAPFSKLSASKPRGRGEVYRFYSHRSGKVEQWPHTTGMRLLSLQPVAKQASWDHLSSGVNKKDAETRLEGIHYPSLERSNYPELSWVGGSHPAGIPECMPFHFRSCSLTVERLECWILDQLKGDGKGLGHSRPDPVRFHPAAPHFKAIGRSEAPAEPRTGRRNRPEKNSETGAKLKR